MEQIQQATAALEAIREAIGDDAYGTIKGGLVAAIELRTAPGREATAAERVRSGEGFRRQPHLEERAAPLAAGPTRRAAAPAETPDAKRKLDRMAGSLFH